jgi:ribosomal protein S18 acetylase RimI-like enzyme
MNIQPATLRDLPTVIRLEKICFPMDAWPLLDMVAVLVWPKVVRLKAVEGGKLVGFIASESRPFEKLAWIATLGVLPEYQRRGIGLQLLLACERILTQPRIRLCVRVNNEAAINLYMKEGYRAVDTWREYYNDKGSALLMEKRR